MDDPFLFFFAGSQLPRRAQLGSCWSRPSEVRQFAYISENKRTAGTREGVQRSESSEGVERKLDCGEEKHLQSELVRSRRVPHGSGCKAAPHGPGCQRDPPWNFLVEMLGLTRITAKSKPSWAKSFTLRVARFDMPQVRQKDAKRLKLRPFGRGSPCRMEAKDEVPPLDQCHCVKPRRFECTGAKRLAAAY